MEKLTFEQFMMYTKSTSNLGYIIYGEDYIFQFFLDEFKKTGNFEIINMSNNLDGHLKRLRYRSLVAPRKLAYYRGKVDKNVVDLFNSYLDRAADHVTIIVHYEEKPRLLRSFGKGFKIVNIKYPSYNWVKKYIEHLCIINKVQWGKDAQRTFMSRIGREYSRINNYILQLIEGNHLIQKEDVIEVVEDNSLASRNSFYAQLVLAQQKKKPYQVYQDFLDGGVTPAQLWFGFSKYINLLYQAKMMRMYGVLMRGSIVTIRKAAAERLPFELGDDTIFDQSSYFIDQLLEVADKVTLRRIIQVRLYVDAAFRRSRSGKRYISSDEDVFVSFINLYNDNLSSIDPAKL